MKRARETDDGGSDDERPAKRRPLRHEVSIVSTDLNAVRESYHTDCEIVATGGEEPHRVFPVNRLVVGSWSEPFRVMVNGKFAESSTRRIELPYTAAVVELAVQHMYYLMHISDPPVVPPALAYATMQLAHMYDQRDLLDLCVEPLWKSDTFQKEVPGDVTVLRTLLIMGVGVEALHEYYMISGVHFPPFSCDVNDDVLKPFLTYVYACGTTWWELLMASEFTEELRISCAYTVYDPARWSAVVAARFNLLEAGDPRVAKRVLQQFLTLTETMRETKCGVLSLQDMQIELQAVHHSLTRSERAFVDNYSFDQPELDKDGVEFTWFYEKVMRRLHPLPGMVPSVAESEDDADGEGEAEGEEGEGEEE